MVPRVWHHHTLTDDERRHFVPAEYATTEEPSPMPNQPRADNPARGSSWSGVDRCTDTCLDRDMNTTTPTLTRTAIRNLRSLAAGEVIDMRYGPFAQLINAGYITGTHAAYAITDAGRQAAQS